VVFLVYAKFYVDILDLPFITPILFSPLPGLLLLLLPGLLLPGLLLLLLVHLHFLS
jgi:hypothetical protein